MVKENHETLSRFDSQGGDGDHGTTMVRAMNRVEKALEVTSATRIEDLTSEIGWAILGVDGGAAGPLFGTFFMGMSKEAAGKETLDACALSAVFEAGLESVEKQTRARVGDKTMIDALAPAVRALREAAGARPSIEAALEDAARAAEAGALSTKNLVARFGRAKNLGEKSRGGQDPGATSVYLIFRGFTEGVKS
jgi:dihydroxyacetone kinase-like protein